MIEDRYPGYDVMRKRHSPSWNEQMRLVMDKRLAVPREPRFFNETEWKTLNAVCDRIVPQPERQPPIPTAAYVDFKLYTDRGDGYRNVKLPRQGEAWQRALAALDEEARQKHGARFHMLGAADQDALLHDMQDGRLTAPAWGGMPCDLFFSQRLIPDITGGYYSHPEAWNEMGYGGPASPRGYVRMGFNRRDPWEAVEAKPGHEEKARRENEHVR